jgi:hypothetical protein
MQVPSILRRESRTRLLQGIAIGAVAAIFVGFYWGGWVTDRTARSMASAAQTNGQMSVLVPLCVAQFMAIDGAVTKIKAEPSFNHYEVVRDLVKTVAGTEMDYSFARLCATAVDDVLAKSAVKS